MKRRVKVCQYHLPHRNRMINKNFKHHTTQRRSFRNNPTQNKQMSITIILPLQNRTTHLFNCTKIYIHFNVTDLWTAPVEVGNLLAEWKGRPFSRWAWMLDQCGIPLASVPRNGYLTHPTIMVRLLLSTHPSCV